MNWLSEQPVPSDTCTNSYPPQHIPKESDRTCSRLIRRKLKYHENNHKFRRAIFKDTLTSPVPVNRLLPYQCHSCYHPLIVALFVKKICQDNSPTPSKPYFKGCWDKSMSPFPLRNHIIPGQQLSGFRTHSVCGLMVPGPNSCLIGKYVYDFWTGMGYCYINM